MINNALVLSLFPGIDLLGRAFNEAGFCVVQGPDKITGGDIRDFTPPMSIFDGIIAGSPCQDFSSLNRKPGDYGSEMLSEFVRVVSQAKPRWFLFENVVRAPLFQITGFKQQRFALDLAFFSPFSRRRDFVFGTQEDDTLLNPINGVRGQVKGTCVTGSDERSFQTCCEIQGLPQNFDLPFFTLQGKKQAVANGVPLPMGRHVASLIAEAYYDQEVTTESEQDYKRCECGCFRIVTGRQKYNSATCRKRAQRKRERLAGSGRDKRRGLSILGWSAKMHC